MRRLIPFVLLSILISFTACKKPPLPLKEDITNGGGQDGPSAFVGNWTYSKVVMTNGEVFLGQNSFGTFDGTGKDLVGFVNLKEDPNTFTAELAYTAAVDLVVFGQTQQQEIPVEKRVITGTWTESNGQIKITANDGTALDIISSSANKIVFAGEFAEKLSLGGQFELDATADVEFTIEK